MIRLLKWLAVNGFFAACVYAAIAHGINGAENIVVFMVAIMFILSLLYFHPDVGDDVQEKIRKRPRYYDWLDMTYDVILILVFVYVGWWWVASLFTFTTFILVAQIQIARKEKSE